MYTNARPREWALQWEWQRLRQRQRTTGTGSTDRFRKGVDGGPADDFDRLPPQNLDAELCVLGSVLLDNDALHEVIPLVKAEDFYRDSHQAIYRAIRDLYDLGQSGRRHHPDR